MDPNADDKLLLLLRLGRHAEAERAARAAVAADPESGPAYYYLAQALLHLDRFHEALDVSDRVLALTPDRWYAHTQRAAVLLSVGRTPEAVEAAETAMRLDHAEPAVHIQLAAALLSAGRENDGAAVIFAARNQFPTNPAVLSLAAAVALDRKDMDAAARMAKRGLALDPTNPRFHMLEGVATGHQAQTDAPEGPERQARYRAAERRLADAVRMDPTNAEFRKLRKNNARDSREAVMVKLMTGWLFGMVFAALALPVAFDVAAFPCWFFVVVPLAVVFLSGVCSAAFPEFALVLPLGWFDVVSVPLLPEERRRGLAVWLVFLAVTATALLLPLLLLPARVPAPAAPPARRDGGVPLPLPAKGKTRER